MLSRGWWWYDFLLVTGDAYVDHPTFGAAVIGRVLEDMSYLSMRDVKPAYIDVLLEGKFLRDEESLVTLEIMFDSYYSDIGFMTGSSGITILNDLRDYVKDNRSDYVSRIEKSALDKIGRRLK